MTQTTLNIEVASVLIDIEAHLRQLQLWQAEAPSAEALSSTEPFCVDTLSFPQWLQFLFIPRLRLMMEQGLELPRQCSIAPMAEEYFRVAVGDSRSLLEALGRVDRLLTR